MPDFKITVDYKDENGKDVQIVFDSGHYERFILKSERETQELGKLYMSQIKRYYSITFESKEIKI